MSRDGEIWAVLPIKDLNSAKGRLSAAFPPAFRRDLMIAMVEDVLSALAGAERLQEIVVVTIDPLAEAIGRRWGARISHRSATQGHTAAVMGGAALILEEGVGGMLALPGDVPGVTAAEVDRLIEEHHLSLHRGGSRAFTIAPAHDRKGSNGIVVTPPDLVPLSYGDDSYLPHLHRARDAGVSPTIVELEGLALDIDHPHDLMCFSAKPWRTRTHNFLHTNKEVMRDSWRFVG
jgi:2-phospho-L-lactate guanylyltransferase